MQIVQTTPQTAQTLAYSNQSKPDAAHLLQEEIFMMSGDIWVEMKGVWLFILVPWKPVEKVKTMFLPFDMS